MPRLPDLHTLANTPGFGRAQQELEKAGFLNGDDTTLPRWQVVMTAHMPVGGMMFVRAENETAAATEAKRRAGNGAFASWERIGDAYEFNVFEVTAAP